MIAREEQAQLRMEVLLEITQAATSTWSSRRSCGSRWTRSARRLRRSLLGGAGGGQGAQLVRVVATRQGASLGALSLDLVKYPELQRALETRRPCAWTARGGPADGRGPQERGPPGTRSVLVQPLICQDDLLGRCSSASPAGRDFGREEQEFLKAAAGALANSIRNSRLLAALKRKRDDLESAYVDRYAS